MVQRRALLLIGVMFLAAGCSSNGATEPGAVTITFEGLRLGDQVSIDAVDATLRFAEAVSDSRCPEDATCIWEGNARLALLLVGDSGLVTAFHLNTSPNAAEGEGQIRFLYGGYEISIAQLLPRPRTDRVISPGEYRLDVLATPVAPTRP